MNWKVIEKYIDIDKVALKEATQRYISHPILLKARLLYDGGYYQVALDQLQEHTFFDNAEYFYRMARIKYKLDFKNLEVILDYQKSVELSEKSTNYYGPMSILQTGLIYEKNNDVKNAEDSFNKCLSMSNFDYERGIHQKAKAGLDRIKD